VNTIINKRFVFVFLAALMSCMTVLSACSDNGIGYTFKANIEFNPENLDPQLACDKSSLIIIGNMFEGLMKLNEDGSVVNGAAESYNVSEDGMTYTFKLKDNIYWEGVGDFKAKLSADDFVYAFKRIYDSSTNSPYRDTFKCIKNASAIENGLKDVDSLGVRADDALTLTIELDYPYYNFIYLLTSTAAMPCNEEFFISTKGRYGLAPEATISNGAFYLKEWNYDPYWNNNYIIMRRNKSNSEYDSIYPSGLNFFITGDSTKDISDFSDGNIDCMSTDIYNKKLFNSANVKLYKTKSAGLFLNPKSEIFGSSSLRYALAASFDREKCKEVLPDGFDIAYGIIPNGITILNKSVRDIVPEADYSLYDVNTAQRNWTNELSKLDVVSLDGVKIMVSENFAGSDALHCVTEQWQNNLNFFCSIEVVSAKEYQSRIESGDFDIILSEFDNIENDPAKCFDYFVSDNEKNILGYSNSAVDSKASKILKSLSLNESVSAINAAELEIINDSYYIPLFYESKYFLTNKNAQGIEYNPYTGQIYFKESKMFD